MSGQLVSWRDYEGVNGFGQASSEELQQFRKALSAGNDRDPVTAAPGVGFPLRVESLEHTLKNTTFRMEHVRFWRMIPKLPAFNTVEEYNQIQSYGQSRLGAFMAEGDLPEETDGQYERKFATVKYMGVTQRLTHVMSMVKPAHGNVIAQKTIEGTMRLVEQIERGLFSGDDSLDMTQWTGIERLITRDAAAANVIDMRGLPLTEDAISDGALTIMDAPNYGIPTHILMNPKNKGDLIKGFYPRARYDQFNKTSTGKVGLNISGMETPAGDVEFVPDVFIDDGGLASAVIATGDINKRPASPTISTAALAGATAGSQFVAADIGNYFYWIVAYNSKGNSAPVAVNAVTLAVTTGNGVAIGVTPGAGPAPTWYELYRTPRSTATGTARRIMRVPNTGGAGAMTITDLNANLPGTFRAFMLQMNLDNISFKQLAPMIKIPLSTVDTSIRWMQLLYGTPVLYTPNHNVMFKNVGRAADYVGAL